ncbi:hypothetical protein [Sphingorhabdus sp. SMR4y]|uniref:hypothetical protein n=1 Tax=Sphingorhabdus sp. SMR4y TaxID=2584094 RepID=UPI000B612ED2|nr:hypothetical protein [Sphingorhabdus sp. SMR4y]ASK89738.1 hypothetical protein SPHFLASMR4Y_03005 [Sphingorhabdus sp. SMR4y]
MIRTVSWILASALAVSGCAGPIQTRVQTHQLVAPSEQKTFTTSPVDAVANRDLVDARDLVTQSLERRGYISSSNASILVHVALADRPADIAVEAGTDKAAQSITPAKKQKRFQSCKDREHRLTVSLFDQVRGRKLYSGSAAEYHCKGTIAQSLPHLIDSALSGLDKEPTAGPRSSVRTRQGIE